MEIIKNTSLRGRRTDRLETAGFPEITGSYPDSRINGYHPQDDYPLSLDTDPLSPTFLYSNRIIAFDSSNAITHAYDVLRNHLINQRKEADTRVISVSAPSAGCGTTVTTVNLALSFARVPGANVLLVDANARNPGVGKALGLAPEPSYEDLVHGWLSTIDIRGVRLRFLRAAWGTGRIPLPADLARMTLQVEANRQLLRPTLIIFDLPPMLNSDEVIPFIDMSDTAVIVAAVGKSKRSDLEICRSYIGPTKSMQVVLNKTKRHGL
ncbi:P-loop NTPase family protein [Rhizobium terrae]|uniref:hypothetical protein n=1 Tax=Rhizobium terrae TaxID=2171756 RepID=UPI000E3CC28A|nr:hypothetical protein [Rhizobium terrae]